MKTRMSLGQHFGSGRESAPFSGKFPRTRACSSGIITRPRICQVAALVAWACLGLVLSCSTPALAAGISASVEPRQFSTDDAARLTVTLSGESVSDPVLPSVDGLEFHPLGQSSQTRIINGVVSASRSHTYLVIVSETGTYEIPPIKARIDGIVRQSAPVSLRVSQGSGLSRKQSPPAVPRTHARGGPDHTPEMSEEEAQSLAFLRIQPAKTTSYVGELVPVQIKAYFRESLQARLEGPPRFVDTAFTWHNPVGEPQRTREVVGNQVYSVLTWYAGMSAPKPGEYPVTAQLQATLLVPDGARSRGHSRFGGNPFDSFFGGDVFGDFFGRLQERRVTLASQPHNLRVEPLPTAGQPADFTGAVGRFNLTVSASPLNPAPGDPVTLHARLSGFGNFDRAFAPRLSNSQDFKTYDPTSNFESRDTIGYEGEKTFEQVIIPKHPAVAEIPALSFSYFDPDAGQYQTVRTAPIPLHIASVGGLASPPQPKPQPAAQVATAPVDSASSDGTELASAIVHELGHLSPDLKPTLFQPWFIALQALPLLALGCGLYLLHRAARRRLACSRSPNSQLPNSQLPSSISQIAAVRHAAQVRLGELWQLPPATITLADIRKRLPQALELQRAFATADAAAYAGQSFTPDQLQSFHRSLQQELDALGEGRGKR